MKRLLGVGIVSWEGSERRSNRYGAIALTGTDYDQTTRIRREWQTDALKQLHGKRVRLTAVVKEARKSGHIGDVFLKVFPTQPEVGEVIEVGVGTLRAATAWDGGPEILLVPGDGREELWIDPRKLYRLHDQTVEIYAEETDAPDHVVEPFETEDDAGTEDLGDGSVQMKKVADPASVRAPMDFEKIGDGLFIGGFTPKAGRRF